MSAELTIYHNAGFFSCCCFRLGRIIDFFNVNKREPFSIDCSTQFELYKDELTEDLTKLYFKPSSEKLIVFNEEIVFNKGEQQFVPYRDLDFKHLEPFVTKYFTPSELILKLLNEFEIKNEINYSNLVGVFYRGNDKHKETTIATYEEFFSQCEQFANKNSNIRFFLQTDETEFKNQFLNCFPNSVTYSKLITANFNKRTVIHSSNLPTYMSRSLYGAHMFSAVLSLAKCKYLITHSGNGSIWAALYRGNADGIYQYINHEGNNLGFVSSTNSSTEILSC